MMIIRTLLVGAYVLLHISSAQAKIYCILEEAAQGVSAAEMRAQADRLDAEANQHIREGHEFQAGTPKALAKACRNVADAIDRMTARAKLPDVFIGMAAEQVRSGSNWGPPSRVNRTTTASGIREQWVYPSGFLYFENGKLVAIQEGSP
jgi:hypothetical protein